MGWWPGRTRIEIIVGAILTQGTAWKNVERAIAALRRARVLSVPALARIPETELALAIRSSGYYRQKAKKIKAFLDHLFERYEGNLSRMARTPTPALRRELLGIWGVGPETADSILLYAFGRPVFVVDTYTHRLLLRHNLHPGGGYERVRIFLEKHLEPKLYNDFHAQIVWAGSRFCGTKPRCDDCPLSGLLPPDGPRPDRSMAAGITDRRRGK